VNGKSMLPEKIEAVALLDGPIHLSAMAYKQL
jgi:hypothetical protein